MFGFKTAEMHAICQKDYVLPQLNAYTAEQKFPVRYKSNVFSYQIRFTVYTNEHQFDEKFSQIEHKPSWSF